MNWLKLYKVHFVLKYFNPPPVFYPMKKIWAQVKTILKNTRMTIRTVRDMQNNCKKCVNKVEKSVVHNMMDSLEAVVSFSFCFRSDFIRTIPYPRYNGLDRRSNNHYVFHNENPN